MSATAAFLSAWRRYDAKRVALVKIDLVTPSALTLRYGTSECGTPDGNVWQTGAVCDAISETIDVLGPGVTPVSASVRLANRRDASQSSGTIENMLSQYLFQNATVTIYLWELTLTSFSDALQVFSGTVSRPTDMDPSGLTLQLLQDLSWNIQLPTVLVDKTSYPNAPDSSQGVGIPILYGKHDAIAMLAPWTTAYGSKSKQEDSGAGLGVIPGILVDTGVGSGKAKVLFAGHNMGRILDRANGASVFIVGGSDALDPIDTAGVASHLTASEAYIDITDETLYAYAAVIPIDVRTTAGNTSTDPRKAISPFNEVDFAALNQTTGKNELQLIIPNLSSRGVIISAQVYVAFTGNAANTQNIRVNGYIPGTGFGAGAAVTAVSTGTTPQVMVGTWPATYYTQAWDFGSTYDIRVDFAGAVANNKASIHWVAIVVKYRPNLSVVVPARTIVGGSRIIGGGPLSPGFGGAGSPSTPHPEKLPDTFFDAVYKLDAQFYANGEGQTDDPGGTFTGIAGSVVIERPCDIVKHLLYTYAYGSPGNFNFMETGAGVSGSFTDARGTLRNAGFKDFAVAARFSDRTNVQAIIQALCQQSASACYLDRISGKWLFYVWKNGAVPSYDKTITWDDVAAFKAEQTSVVDVKQVLRVQWGFDHFRGKTLFESFITDAASGQGFTEPTVPDQRLTVVNAVNDRIDWSQTGTGTFAATITAGTYAPMDLAVEARLRMRAASGNNDMNVGYGFDIRTGFNDLLDFKVGATTYLGTMNQGHYTAEGFATEFARAMNAVPGHGLTFVCTYDHGINRFTVSAGSNFQLLGNHSAPSYTQSAVRVFGENGTAAAATSRTSNVERYGDRFWFMQGDLFNDTFNLLWATGANQATRPARTVFGFNPFDTGSLFNQCATYIRGNRSDTAATLRARYGPRPELQFPAEFIRDEETAVQLRDRVWDLAADPRVMVRFSTHRMPDAHRMMTFQFDSSLDAHVPYPLYGSDGSWAGKTLRVLEVNQNLGPDFSTEILAISAD